MKTISTKELSLHLDEVFDRVLNGEEITVNHHDKGLVTLSRLSPIVPRKRQEHDGLRAFDNAPKRQSPFDGKKPIKQLYRESSTILHS